LSSQATANAGSNGRFLMPSQPCNLLTLISNALRSASGIRCNHGGFLLSIVGVFD